MFNLLSTTYLVETLEPIVKWLTIGFITAILLTAIVVAIAKRDTLSTYFKSAIISFTVYALIVGITMLILEIIKHYDPAYLEENYVNSEIVTLVFLPILITLFCILVSTVTAFILKKKGGETGKTVIKIGTIISGLALLLTVILVAVFFYRNVNGDGYYTDGYGNLNNFALYFSAGLIIVLTIGASLLFDKSKDGFTTRTLSVAGVCVALSFALSFIRLWKMPQGGSVTLASMLPIMIFSYRFGAKKGVLVGLIYGLLQAVQDPFIIHPAQFILDYPIAFATIGLVGLPKNIKFSQKLEPLKFALCATLGAILRFICHVLSGVFAFGAYALDAGASNILIYSLAYNSFVFVDLVLVIVVGVMLFSSKAFKNELNKQ